eukprot:COSAG01_NODE_6230_length_3778_cov_28.633324_3_plen_76_part_00
MCRCHVLDLYVLDLYYTVHHCTVVFCRAKSGAADSDCGLKLGAKNSLSGFNQSGISSKTTVLYTVRGSASQYCTR